MRKVLAAITYHSQRRPSVWKSCRSTSGLQPVLFCHDKSPDFECAHILTGEETLGGKRNAAIKYARANGYGLIAFLDDDDLFGPSWVKALLELEPQPKTIYHPQFNVMFQPDVYKLHEHIGMDDPCFDSRDFLNFNLWSALCAFDPMAVDIQYRKHSATDKRESFEDWSFNLDTLAAGYKHVTLPDTFHFLRLRSNSLGKSTQTCGPAHSSYFLDSSIRDMQHATKEHPIGEVTIDDKKIIAEFKAIHEIEPQLYYWGQKYENGSRFQSERYGRCAAVSDHVGRLGVDANCQDVFWTFDPSRTGGAEKALSFAGKFLARFPLGKAPKQAWISDDAANKAGIDANMWWSSLTGVMKAWQDSPAARSLHICNTVAGWHLIARNPEIFNRVQVYLYTFNDDLRFEGDDNDTKGFHSPLYRYAELVDRPNFHIITDSQHFAQRIHEKTGLGDRVRIIDIPVVPQECKRKEETDGKIDVLWAGRLDNHKGLDMILKVGRLLGDKFLIHVWGDGHIIPSGMGLVYRDRYKSFEYITGKYDFMWFTSEREGMPNVVKEALSAGIPVLARAEDWCDEMPGNMASYPRDWDAEQIADLIKKFDPVSFVPQVKFDFEAAIPRATFAYKECLV